MGEEKRWDIFTDLPPKNSGVFREKRRIKHKRKEYRKDQTKSQTECVRSGAGSRKGKAGYFLFQL